MNRIFTSALLLTLTTSAFAQDEYYGARPGNVIGTGSSLPYSDQASNISGGSEIAPNLPAPEGVEDGDPVSLLRLAQGALANNQTGKTQQALEMAESRLLDRSTPLYATNRPSHNAAVGYVSQARHALDIHNYVECHNAIGWAIFAIHKHRMEQERRATRYYR